MNVFSLVLNISEKTRFISIFFTYYLDIYKKHCDGFKLINNSINIFTKPHVVLEIFVNLYLKYIA